MNIQRLFRDHNVVYYTEGKNVSPGWTNVRCCWCNDTSNHLGFSPSGTFVCWRCGAHPFTKTLARLLDVDENAVYDIVKEYGGRRRPAKTPTVQIRRKAHRLPSGTGLLNDNHRRYLIKRGFDPDELVGTWGLLATGPVALLDKIDYKHRIVAPIMWNNKQVSFQARDITDRHRLRYISCPPERELIAHKDIVYGRQDLWTDTGICVEGITDVWRFGTSAFATFGTEFTKAQVRVIAAHFKKVFIVFDSEDKAQLQARQLADDLCERGLRVYIRTVTASDPGSMSQSEAKRFLRSMLST